MALHRLTSLTLAVPDVAASSGFFADFGLTSDGDGWFSTRDGGRQVELVQAPQRQLQRLGVGATDPDDFGRIAARVEATGLGSVAELNDERLVLIEPVTGMHVEITVAPKLSAPAGTPTLNTPADVERWDGPAPAVLADGPAPPSNMTHLVYGTPDYATSLKFFTEVVGFEISDAVGDFIAFTRCGEVHHNLALQAAPTAFVHHIAFEMDSIDDVVRRGQHMVDADPDRHTWGLGRHAIGSNWFWYLREPGGHLIEYATDIDRISDQDSYTPKDWNGQETLYSFGPPVPEEFLVPRDMEDLIAASSS